jgi:beta-lactamase class A
MRYSQPPAHHPSAKRHRLSRLLLIIVLFTCSSITFSRFSVVAAASNDLDRKIEELIRSSGAETVAVACHDVSSGTELLINPDITFHAASTMKVPVMMEIYRQAAAGKLSLDQRIPVKNDFASIVDGSHYSLTADSDSDQSLYTRVGETATIRELMHLMITVSSNLAANLLIERVTPERVMDLMRTLGANNIRVLRGVEDGKAFEKGLNNVTTARDLMILLRRIAERRAVSAKASDEMIKVMLDQKFNEGIPAGLPADARVSHKTGSITKINHDAAIVYPAGRKPYVLVVLTRGIEDEKVAHKLIADISRVVYEQALTGRGVKEQALFLNPEPMSLTIVGAAFSQ